MEKKGLKLAPIFCNGMILQRDTVNHIYGTDELCKNITIHFRNHEYHALVDENGDFCAEIPPVNAGGPYEMIIEGSESIHISDILFGDVFLLTGQSNMELPIRRVLDVSAKEIANSKEPMIRQYLLSPSFQFDGPRNYMQKSSWKSAENEDLMGFSAAGFFFAKEIKGKYQIPVGLVLAAAGGSSVEAWMSKEDVKVFDEYNPILEKFYNLKNFEDYISLQQKDANNWLDTLKQGEWKLEEVENYQKWHTCRMPSLVSDFLKVPFHGSVYFVKEVTLEEEPDLEMDGIYMGTIIDSDCVWVNGELIGRTEYRYPPRKYKIPHGILRKGKNLIMVRIVINKGNGGMIKGRPYYLKYNGKKISLLGEWYYRIGKRVDTPIPEVLFPPSLPTGLFHTVIAPMSKISIKGILWYQGESNTHKPERYYEKFSSMLKSWRKLFQFEVPCIYVQLPNYREPLNTVEDSGWAAIREEQRKCLSLNQVAMAVAIDLGEANDLHPQNKKGVGIRLAKAADYLIYHNETSYTGPLPDVAEVIGSYVKLKFKYLEDFSGEEVLNHFELAGEDNVFYQAHAIRIGKQVTLSSEWVDSPVYVRYAWCDNPAHINFYNNVGLPAAGFCLSLNED